jgi:hypothetical protein
VKSKDPKASSPVLASPTANSGSSLILRHLRAGWWALLIYLTLGIALEMLHGFKIGFYLDVSNHTRRLMWTLAHAHGTLLALVNIAFAVTLPHLSGFPDKQRKFCSGLLLSALILLPGGFFLGGLVIYSGDPGLGVLLVPLGALFLLCGVFLTARASKPS